MGDAGIGEQPFDVLLDKADEIPQGHGKGGQHMISMASGRGTKTPAWPA